MEAIATYGPDVSTGQIAAVAGVARTRIYKHFEDAADLQAAIAERALELVATGLEPVWNLEGSAKKMISGVVDAVITYLADHQNLYHYLTKYAPSARNSDRDVVTDVKTGIGTHLTRIFVHFLTEFGAETKMAGVYAFSLVGMVESAVNRWLDEPEGVTREELAAHLTRQIWLLLDAGLRANGVELDPDAPLVVPSSADVASPG